MAKAKKSKKSKKVIIVKLVPEKPVYDTDGKLIKVQFYYTKKRNQKMEGGHEGKLRLRKYYPPIKQHIMFIEQKISKSKK